ncbi:hypothetical protein ALC60_07680 [Trachymyrmex zeteki]|uniref:Uncharacterized protein n=1 Tax=Mycetomoellerius zeteki TaxID=64791 RepID=A0A151WYJ0_9HYME|nr:hypothetical protein ALC60_07680 [Trachymyrmex zeteki]
MQDDDLTSTCRDDDREIESKAERETFYDIWKADDSSTGRSDDGYSESTPRIDNYAETRCRVSGCTFNNKSQRSQSENINEQTVERDEHTRGEWIGNGDVCPTDRIAGNKARNDEDDTMCVWNENLSNSSHKNVDSIGRNEYRMRGGCSGCCCGARESVWRSSQGYGCCCGRFVPVPNESCAPSPDRVKTMCVMPSRSCCCRPQVYRKSARCEPPPCTTNIRSCGGDRCCGGCGKPGQICASSPRICNSPANSSRGRSPCAPRCLPQPPCSISGCRSFCSGPNNCRRSCSPRCLSTIGNGCCSVNNRAKCGTDGACCRLRLPCECLGGGLDCRRCGRKVYQAEMQVARSSLSLLIRGVTRRVFLLLYGSSFTSQKNSLINFLMAVLLGWTVLAILRYYSQVLTNAFNEGVSSLPSFRFLLLAANRLGAPDYPPRLVCSYNNSAIPSRCSFHYFFSSFVAAAFASPSSSSSATSTTASPQPTAATAAAAAERVISRDVDEVEVIPKRRRGRSIPPPPTTATGDGARCTLRVGCLQPSTTTWPEPAAGAVVDVCTSYTEGGKSCKKNPRHSAPTSSVLFLPFSLSRSFSPLSTLYCPRFRSTPAGNRRRVLLKCGTRRCTPVLLPALFVPSAFPPSFCLFALLRPSSSRSFILARLKGTYVCMASCTPLLCEMEEETYHALSEERAPLLYACTRTSAWSA